MRTSLRKSLAQPIQLAAHVAIRLPTCPFLALHLAAGRGPREKGPSSMSPNDRHLGLRRFAEGSCLRLWRFARPGHGILPVWEQILQRPGALRAHR